MKKAYLINIKGRVTGVGFRYSAINRVNDIKRISGYVRNVDYGEVEVLIQGENEELTKILQWLQKGPPLARVDSFTISEIPLNKNIDDFRIR